MTLVLSWLALARQRRNHFSRFVTGLKSSVNQ